jgi:general secretion pathway protein F
MPSFRFTAIDPGGQMRRGVMEAPSAAFVIDRLQRDGNIPMRAEPAGWRNSFGALLSSDTIRRRGLSRDEVAVVLRELATMLAAGQDVDRALRFIVETASSRRLFRVMEQVRTKVRGGSTLHAALGEPPANFPRLHVGLIRAGEAGGTLGDTMGRLADLMERERSLARAVTSALIYPALLVTAALASIILLVSYVLPQFLPLFQESGAQLPTPTRLLMAFGQTMSAAWPYLLVLVLLVALLGSRAMANPRLKRPVDRILLRLPVIGTLLRENNAARFCRTLGTMIGNGVPLISALGIMQHTIGNLAVLDAIEKAMASAKSGAGLSRALEAERILPVRATHLLRLGEETAQLAPMALKAAEIHEERTRQSVQRMVALLVPVITIVMGAVVAGIVGSLLLAMLSLNDLAG